MTDTSPPPAGWYDDGSGRLRAWDGSRWTDHYEDPTPGAADVAASAPATGPTPRVGTADTSASAPATDGSPHGAGPSAPATGAAPRHDAASEPATKPVDTDTAPTPVVSGQGPSRASAADPSDPDSRPNTLGVVALGVALVGFVLAFLPFASGIAWALVAIALVLAGVSFFLRGRRWPAIVAITVAVLTAIMSVVLAIVYAYVGQPTATLPDAPDVEAPVATDAPAVPADGGSAVNDPLAPGAVIVGEEYTVVVNSVALDADDQVLANPANLAPPDGLSYAVVNVTITYTGATSGFSYFVRIAYLAPDGTEYSAADTPALPPDPVLGPEPLPPGASSTGNVVVAIPDAADGVLEVTPGIDAPVAFVAIR